MRYMVVIEKTSRNYCAYSPDVPGCIAAADTAEETATLMHEALELHFEDGEPLPEPVSSAMDVKGYVVVIEKTSEGYRASTPDLPFIVAAADTRERVEALIRETVADYLTWHCKRPPEPATRIAYVDVEAPQPVSV